MEGLEQAKCLDDHVGQISGSQDERGPVRIRYDEAGAGFPLMLLPGGGLNATIAFFTRNLPFNAIGETFDQLVDNALHARQAVPRLVAAGSAVASGAAAAPQTQVVFNSFEELTARVPTTYPSVRSGLGPGALINDVSSPPRRSRSGDRKTDSSPEASVSRTLAQTI